MKAYNQGLSKQTRKKKKHIIKDYLNKQERKKSIE